MLNIAESAVSKKGSDRPVPHISSKTITPVEERERLIRWLNEKISAGHKAPVVEVVLLTPTLAQLLLERNKSNRPVSQINIDRIKKDIIEGRWKFNGESIVVSHDGYMNDGQHRVRAVLETGKPIQMVIVFGPERESRMTIGQGVPRTVGHYLAMHGYTDANALAAAANLILQYRDHGQLFSHGRMRPTKTETLLVAEHYKDIFDSLKVVSKPGAGVLATRSMLAFCHLAIARASSHSAANDFFDGLIGGASLEPGSPILYCRQRLMQTKSSHRIGDRAELIFRAWNAWRRSEIVERLFVLGKKLPKLES